MPSNHLIPVTLFSIFPSIRVFSSESVLHIRWPKYRSYSFRISPPNEYSRLISFRIDWMDPLAVQGTLNVTELSVKCLYVQIQIQLSPRNTNFNLQTFKEVNVPSMMRKWELLPRLLLGHFFQKVDRFESSKESEPVSLMSEVNEIAACPPSAIADHCSCPPSLHLFSPLQSVTLPACSLNVSPCLPAVVLYYCAFLFLHFIFTYYLCEKYYKPTTIQYYIANCVSWVSMLTLLDLWTNWT